MTVKELLSICGRGTPVSIVYDVDPTPVYLAGEILTLARYNPSLNRMIHRTAVNWCLFDGTVRINVEYDWGEE